MTKPISFNNIPNAWTAKVKTNASEDAFPQLNTFDATRGATSETLDNLVHTRFNAIRDAETDPKRQRKILKEEDNIKNGLRNSTISRGNITATIRLPGNKKTKVRYAMVRNSPLNGYKLEGAGEPIKKAISSSLDRTSEHCTLARSMEIAEKDRHGHWKYKPLCYAARPDTPEKLQEVVSMVFTSTKRDAAPSNAVYQPRIAIFSLIGTADIGDAESDLIKAEKDMLDQQARNPPMQIDDENNLQYQVKPEFALFCRQFNFMSTVEKVLPGSVSGQKRAEEFSQGSLATLERWVNEERALKPFSRRNEKILQSAFKQLKEGGLTTEEDLFLRILICQKARIPYLLHCRSCVDRTSIAAAMSYAAKICENYIKDPENPLSLLDDERFKEAFAAHIAVALETTRYSRNQYGFKWHTGPFPLATFHPALPRLLPERYLTDFQLFNKELSIPGRVIAIYGGILLFRYLNSLFSWMIAKDHEHESLKRVLMGALRTLLLLAPVILGYTLALAWTLLVLVGILIAGTGYGCKLACKHKDATYLALGFLLLLPYLTLPPQKVLKDRAAIDDKPILFSKENPKVDSLEPSTRIY